jgi:hypothetical protein
MRSGRGKVGNLLLVISEYTFISIYKTTDVSPLTLLSTITKYHTNLIRIFNSTYSPLARISTHIHKERR